MSFFITNYRKGGFSALFCVRSIGVRQVRLPRVRKKSSKNTLFTVLRIFADKISENNANRLVPQK